MHHSWATGSVGGALCMVQCSSVGLALGLGRLLWSRISNKHTNSYPRELVRSADRIRGRRAHSGHLCSGEPQDPGAAQPKKIEAVEQEESRTQHQSKVKGQEASCGVVGASLDGKASETGGQCPGGMAITSFFLRLSCPVYMPVGWWVSPMPAPSLLAYVSIIHRPAQQCAPILFLN